MNIEVIKSNGKVRVLYKNNLLTASSLYKDNYLTELIFFLGEDWLKNNMKQRLTSNEGVQILLDLYGDNN